MNPPRYFISESAHEIQLFEPNPAHVHSLEATARIVDVPRHTILVYCKHGLVSPVVDPGCGGFYFNDEAIRVLRRIEYLRSACGINLQGVKMIFDLMRELESLRAEVRFLRGR